MSLDSASSRTAAPRRSSLRRVVAASLIGTSLEWYDFVLYGTAAALIFNKLFFPRFDPLVGTLLAFATYAVGFVARPIGGVVFGHFGDRAGRKTVLVVTLVLMGGATFAIGLLPTYATIGVWAPVLLVALRFVQGIGLGGEWGGAVLMALEHGDERRRGLSASWPQVGVPAGNLLAAGVLALLSWLLPDGAFQSWGWRVPFLLSGLLVLVGLWVRGTVTESPLFRQAEQASETRRAPMVEVLRDHPRSLAVAVGARLGVDVAFYTFTLFILTYATQRAHVPRSVALNAVLVGSAVQLVLIPAFGALSDRVGRRPVYLAGALAAVVWIWAFFALLDTGSTGWIVLAAVGGLVAHAAMYGPQAAFVTELFPTGVRYSGASLGYQVAGVLGGALAPLVSVALLKRFDTSAAVSLYVALALAVTVVAVLLARETRSMDLAAADPAGDPYPEEGAGRARRQEDAVVVRR